MQKRKRRGKGLVVLGVLLFLASFLHFGFGLGRSTMTTTAMPPVVEEDSAQSSANGKAAIASQSTTEVSDSSGPTVADSSPGSTSSTGTVETEHLYGTAEAEKLSGEVSVHIKESQVYWNEEPIELVQLEEKLGQLSDDQRQVKLVDQQAKRVVYQQVEEILQEKGYIIIRTTE